MKKLTNFQRICNLAMDSDEEIDDMFSTTEINAINHGICNNGTAMVYVVCARDKMFSGWGLSKGKPNNVFVICWAHYQACAILNSFNNCDSMANPRMFSIDKFCGMNHRHSSTWSIKNANDCSAWNNGIKVEV